MGSAEADGTVSRNSRRRNQAECYGAEMAIRSCPGGNNRHEFHVVEHGTRLLEHDFCKEYMCKEYMRPLVPGDCLGCKRNNGATVQDRSQRPSLGRMMTMLSRIAFSLRAE